MKWVPLALVLSLLILAIIGARYLPEKIATTGSSAVEKSPIKKAVNSITPNKPKKN